VEEGLVFAAGPVVETDIFSESFACLKERNRLEVVGIGAGVKVYVLDRARNR